MIGDQTSLDWGHQNDVASHSEDSLRWGEAMGYEAGKQAVKLGKKEGVFIMGNGNPGAPAGATTLIISLGILTHPWQLVVLMIAIILLTLQAIAINRLFGMPLPLWSPPAAPAKSVDGADKD